MFIYLYLFYSMRISSISRSKYSKYPCKHVENRFWNVPFPHSRRKVRGHVSPGFFHLPDFIIQFRISRPFLRRSFVHSSLPFLSLFLLSSILCSRFSIFQLSFSLPWDLSKRTVVNSANKKMEDQTIRKKLRFTSTNTSFHRFFVFRVLPCNHSQYLWKCNLLNSKK